MQERVLLVIQWRICQLWRLHKKAQELSNHFKRYRSRSKIKYLMICFKYTVGGLKLNFQLLKCFSTKSFNAILTHSKLPCKFHMSHVFLHCPTWLIFQFQIHFICWGNHWLGFKNFLVSLAPFWFLIKWLESTRIIDVKFGSIKILQSINPSMLKHLKTCHKKSFYSNYFNFLRKKHKKTSWLHYYLLN